MTTALALEWLKFRRSTVAVVATTLVLLGTPAFSLGMVALARAESMTGPTSAKFEPALEGTLNEAHLMLAGQILTVVMMLAAGFVATWVFGREHADRTIGSLFAQPVTREVLAWAKVLVTGAWVVAVATFAVAVTLLGSWVVDAAGITASVVEHAATVWVAGILMGWLGIPFGWVAVLTRGYLGAVGAIIGATAVGQILASLGVGAWVPYVAPAMWVGAGGDDAAATIGAAHLVLALAFAVVGATGAALTMGRSKLG